MSNQEYFGRETDLPPKATPEQAAGFLRFMGHYPECLPRDITQISPAGDGQPDTWYSRVAHYYEVHLLGADNEVARACRIVLCGNGIDVNSILKIPAGHNPIVPLAALEPKTPAVSNGKGENTPANSHQMKNSNIPQSVVEAESLA